MGGPISLDYPVLQRFNFQGGGFIDKAFIALTLALSLYTGAFIAESVRAGIQAVSRGQTEAAGALGLRPNRMMSLVVLPQALRVIIPPLISQYLNLTKNSSLAIAVGYADVRATLGGITMNQTGRELECMLLLMGFYLVLSLLISSVMNWYNASRRAEGAVRMADIAFSRIEMLPAGGSARVRDRRGRLGPGEPVLQLAERHPDCAVGRRGRPGWCCTSGPGSRMRSGTPIRSPNAARSSPSAGARAPAALASR